MADRPELSTRKATVLHAVVEAYVATGEPVGSETIAERARELASRSSRSGERGVRLTDLARTIGDEEVGYSSVTARLDHGLRRVEIEVRGPAAPPPADAAGVLDAGVDYWPLTLARELDDLVLHLRTNEPELGTWVFRTRGSADLVRAYDEQLTALAGDWFVDEVRLLWKRVLKRLDVTSRSLVGVVEPGSCYVGLLLELALACDRQYMLEDVYEDVDPGAEPATIELTPSSFGAFPMGNGLSRVESRFWGHDDALEAARAAIGRPLDAAAADDLGLVTVALDDIDFADELRIALEERASLSPDALTGMEANHRFVGPETTETKIFGRLTVWQNWIFVRPNASGPDGALRRYGSGQRGSFDHGRV